MKTTYVLLIVLAVVAAGGFAYVLRPGGEVGFGQAPAAPSPSDDTVPWPLDPAQGKPPGVEPIAKVIHVTLKTNKGDIVMALDGTRAPLTVGNFVTLAKKDFYDGTTFHRAIPDFMIQGGDPKGDGTGGPGYQFADEINASSYGLDKIKLIDAIDPGQASQLKPEVRDWTLQQYYEAQGYRYTTDVESLPLQRGVVAMANAGPNTNGSQFFIITAESVPHLAGKHTPFGVVKEGLDVVLAIQSVATDDNDKPLEPVVIEDVVVTDALGQGLETLE